MASESSTARYDARLLHDQRVPARDGITLSADVYLPIADGPFPTIVQWTPYESTRERFVAWGAWFAARGTEVCEQAPVHEDVNFKLPVELRRAERAAA